MSALSEAANAEGMSMLENHPLEERLVTGCVGERISISECQPRGGLLAVGNACVETSMSERHPLCGLATTDVGGEEGVGEGEKTGGEEEAILIAATAMGGRWGGKVELLSCRVTLSARVAEMGACWTGAPRVEQSRRGAAHEWSRRPMMPATGMGVVQLGRGVGELIRRGSRQP